MSTHSSTRFTKFSRLSVLNHSAPGLVVYRDWSPNQAVEATLEFLDVILQVRDLLGSGDRILGRSGLRRHEGAAR